MASDRKRSLAVFTRLALGLLAAVVLAATVGLVVLSSSARTEIDGLATANSDAVQWSLAQSEVELLVLKNILIDLETGREKATLDDLRTRFDVFYSRISTLENAPVFAGIRAVADVERALSVVDVFLDEAVPLIDGPDEVLRAGLPTLIAGAERIRPEMRTISLTGVRVFSQTSERQRDRVADALRDLGVLTFLLFFFLMLLVAALILSLRREHRRTEETRLTQERLGNVIATAMDGIIVVSRSGSVIDFNPAAERIFGYSRDEAVGHDMAELIIPDHMRKAHAEGMERHLRTGEMRVVNRGLVQMEAKARDGRVFPVELSISAAESEDGPIYVSFIRDISRRVEAERELVSARDRALEGEKAKANMLAVMSHEMRTPLNGIIGSLQLLEDTVLDPRQAGFVDIMKSSSQMLLDRVNSVLDISRADSGNLTLARLPLDPAALAESLATSLVVQARARGNRLVARRVGPAIGPRTCDPARLEQVLVNLVGNAIKFTENGTITLEVEAEPQGDEVEFRVIDTGIGIAEDDQDRIFDDFVTLDPSYGRRVEGTGLGLGIVRRLVAAMGGTIGVESEPGDGSLFWVRLPLPRSTEGPSAPRAQVPRSDRPNFGYALLLVEDNAVNRLVATEMLKNLGCTATEAVDGEEGVLRASERAYDAILMDISMPRLDGTEATRRIRTGRGPNAATPILALTAHALPEDIARFRAAGMDDVLLKPLTRDRLQQALSALRRAPSPVQTGPSGGAAGDELVATLGAERAAVLVRAAREEIDMVLGRLLEGDPPDKATLAAEVHRMAGAAAVVGFSTVLERLRASETAAKAGDMPAAMEAARAARLALS